MIRRKDETMAEFETVLKTSDLAPGQMQGVTVDGMDIVVANVEGRFCAFGGICPHEDAPLADGDLYGDVVTCPWHFTEFNVLTGEALEGLTDEPIPVFEVRIEGDDVKVALQEE
jgi:3-phenylpropionate/trans-cinnamate dioxygenase ferredoxin component